MTDDQAAGRPADDYDLLTYGEAAARLAEEIRKERRHLGELEEQGRDGNAAGDVSAAIAAVLRRIGDLTAAAERQARQHREARDFVRFFGYDPRTGRS